MQTKTKTFDCVEMKRKCQETLAEEFAKRREQFPTFTEFLRAKMTESEWVAAVWEKFGGRRP